MSNSDDRVAAANRLGAEVTFDHPVPPRRDRFGAPWCPVCNNGLRDPIYFNDPLSLTLPDGTTVQIHGETILFTGACEGCKQELTWKGWSRYLSDSERMEHINGGCRAPNYCARCKAQLSA